MSQPTTSETSDSYVQGGAVTRESLLWQAMTLPPADREALADALWFSVDHSGDDADNERYSLSAGWREAIQRRIAAYRSGQVKTVDAFEHLKSFKEKYSR